MVYIPCCQSITTLCSGWAGVSGAEFWHRAIPQWSGRSSQRPQHQPCLGQCHELGMAGCHSRGTRPFPGGSVQVTRFAWKPRLVLILPTWPWFCSGQGWGFQQHLENALPAHSPLSWRSISCCCKNNSNVCYLCATAGCEQGWGNGCERGGSEAHCPVIWEGLNSSRAVPGFCSHVLESHPFPCEKTLSSKHRWGGDAPFRTLRSPEVKGKTNPLPKTRL